MYVQTQAHTHTYAHVMKNFKSYGSEGSNLGFKKVLRNCFFFAVAVNETMCAGKFKCAKMKISFLSV